MWDGLRRFKPSLSLPGEYGDLRFDEAKFPDAAGMVRRLKGKGFTVTTWVTPMFACSSRSFTEDGAPLAVSRPEPTCTQ